MTKYMDRALAQFPDYAGKDKPCDIMRCQRHGEWARTLTFAPVDPDTGEQKPPLTILFRFCKFHKDMPWDTLRSLLPALQNVLFDSAVYIDFRPGEKG